MAILLEHPENGRTNVFSMLEYESHLKNGWKKVEEKVEPKVEPVIEKVVMPEPVIEVKPEAKKEVYACDICGKTFSMKMHLGSHYKKHKRE